MSNLRLRTKVTVEPYSEPACGGDAYQGNTNVRLCAFCDKSAKRGGKCEAESGLWLEVTDGILMEVAG